MEYRKMTSKDVLLLTEFEKKSRILEPNVFKPLDEKKHIDLFTSHKVEDYPFNDTILCIDKDEVIGRIDVIYEISFMDFHRIGYVDWVYVQKPYRNKGIAKKLFLEAEKWFKSYKCDLFYLFVAENEEAKAFYDSLDVEIKPINRASKKF